MTHPVMFVMSAGLYSRSAFWCRWQTSSKATLAQVRGAKSTWAEYRG